MSENNPEPSEQVLNAYKKVISSKHPEAIDFWPVLSGYNLTTAVCKTCWIFIFKHTGNPTFRTQSGVGELPTSVIGFSDINQSNKNRVRSRLERHYQLNSFDAVIFVEDGYLADEELFNMLNRHEKAMGMFPSKVFLSHKGADKDKVRDFRETLEYLGFDPWLDENVMAAGVELERGILKGFNDSCAAVFFVTPNFKDENYLASEVNYAIAEKRKKGASFSIVTLVFQENGLKGVIPELLQPYVWKEPKTNLEALREILKALLIKVGETTWK